MRMTYIPISERTPPLHMRLLADLIRMLPAGRYRAMSWLSRHLPADPFVASLPDGSFRFWCDTRNHLVVGISEEPGNLTELNSV